MSDLIYPTINAEARTTRVRMQVENPKGVAFRPGEYGSVEFDTPARKAMTVPRDAVVDTGLHTYVFIAQGEGVFSPREVVLGDEQGEMLTILSGVSPGDRVVSGATFLIDSESRLQASAAQVTTTAPSEPSPGDGPSCQKSITRNIRTSSSSVRNAFRSTTGWDRWKRTVKMRFPSPGSRS